MIMTRRSLFGVLVAPLLARWMPKLPSSAGTIEPANQTNNAYKVIMLANLSYITPRRLAVLTACS